MRVFSGILGAAIGVVILLGLSAIAGTGSAGPGALSTPEKSIATPYNVTFTETGLPAGTNWSVHVAYVGCGCYGVRKTVTSDTPTLTVSVTNGTYRYTVLTVPGYFVNASWKGMFNVTATSIPTISIVFHLLISYVVEFQEKGLPAGTVWTVAVTGNGIGQERAIEDQSMSSTTSAMNFTLPNGTYHYTVSPVAGSFFVNQSNHGWFVVAGASPAPTLVTFTTPPIYAVTFTETGLPSGMNWSIRFGGWGGAPIHETESSTTSTITFMVPNGTYRYAVAEVLGFVVSGPAYGTVTVTTAAVNIGVTFVALEKGAFYPVAFSENGLASGTHWSVTVIATHTFGHSRSATQSSRSSSIFFLLQNGTYRYIVHTVIGYALTSGGSGTFSVAGSAPGAIVVNFTLIPTYSVTFSETGLASGLNWSVLVRTEFAGSTLWPIRLVETSNTTSITFYLPNGSYCYQVLYVPGYQITSGVAAGPFTVSGASPPGITVGFSPKG